jgi:pilus assembly protein CpaE
MSNEKSLQGSGVNQKRGEMIAVCSAKGGVGRTVLAVNLAVALSKNNIQVNVMDGSYQFGDVCMAMDLYPTFSIRDVVEQLSTLDDFALTGFLVHHSSGVKVLAAPERPEYADLIVPQVVEPICDLLLARHDYVIADTGVGLQERSLQLIEKADKVFVVTNLEMATIKNTKLMLETLQLLGLKNKVKVIVNRSTMESVIQASDVADILGEDTPIFIPNQFQIVSQSINVGIPFVVSHGKSDVAKAVFKLAEQMISRREITLFKPKAPGLFQTLFHKPKTT